MTTSAIDTQDLRARMHRRVVWTTAACVAMPIVTIICALTLLAVDASLSDRQNRFDHIQGNVVSVFGGGDDHGSSALVEFEQFGRRQTEQVDIESVASFDPGPVTVLVDPDDPTFVTLPGENYFPLGRDLAVMLLGGCGFLTAACFIWAARARRMTDVLSTSRWQTVSGFSTMASDGDSTYWELFLPGYGGGSFWESSKRIPTPRYTGSVAIHENGRLVLRDEDGKRLVDATREQTSGSWTAVRDPWAEQVKGAIELHYTRVDGKARRCKVDDSDGDTLEAVISATSVELLDGPHQTVAVRVDSGRVVGIGVARSDRSAKRRDVTRAQDRSLG